MDADDRRSGMDVAHHQGHQALDPLPRSLAVLAAGPGGREDALKPHDPEIAPAGWKIRLRYLVYALKRHIGILPGRQKRAQRHASQMREGSRREAGRNQKRLLP
jgi:hypothetical protein